MLRRGLLFVALALSACVFQMPRRQSTGGRPQASRVDVDTLVEIGFRYRSQGRCREALAHGFEPAIRELEGVIAGRAVVAQRDDAMLGLMRAAAPGGTAVITRTGPDGVPRQVISDFYPDVLYSAAFCYVELGDDRMAEDRLRRALTVIPDDPLYLAELGHVFHMRRNWADALPIFVLAADGARALEARSPGLELFGMSMGALRHRCMRGIGFTLIELGRLGEAEGLYRAILMENPNDEQAMRELMVIEQMRDRGGRR